MTDLTTLRLTNTQISDLAPLSELGKLRDLSLNDTPVSDLRPVTAIDTLRTPGRFYTGLHFKNTAATRLDPEGLGRLAEIEDDDERGAQTLDYLNALTEWPPARTVPPEDRPAGAVFRLVDGRLDVEDRALLGDDPDNLQGECREKSAYLIECFGQTNQFAHVVTAAERYRRLITNPADQIGARALYSHGNRLRTMLEAQQAHDKAGNIAQMLPPDAAAALADLVDTHALWAAGFPGMVAVLQAVRDAARDPRDANALDDARQIAADLAQAEGAATDAAAELLASEAAASGEKGPAAENAKAGVTASVVNLMQGLGRAAWRGLKAGQSGLKAIVFAEKLKAALQALWPQIEALAIIVYGEVPPWLEAVRLFIFRP